MDDVTDMRWLDEDEDRAWRGWLAMSGLLRARIDRDLQSECGLTSPEFAVLAHLSETETGRIRMTELADALGWSKSRVSHQCSRMQSRGLVAREGCPDDARSAYAVLTSCGRTEIERAAPRHVASVRRHLVDLLDTDQIRALGAITGQVLAHLAGVEGGVDDGVDAAEGCPPALPPCPTRGRPAGAPVAGAQPLR